jgi:hypothetical protein
MRTGFLAAAAALLLLSGCHEYWGSAGSGDSLSSSGTATATYDPTADDQEAQRNVRAAIPAIEAWHAEHGTYRGMTVPALNSEYDRTIGDNIRLVGPLTKDMYCVESLVGNAAWHKDGPAGIVDSTAPTRLPRPRRPRMANHRRTFSTPFRPSRLGTSTTGPTQA